MKLWAFAGVVGFYVSLVTHATLMLYLLRHDLKTFWLHLPPLAQAAEVFVQLEEDEQEREEKEDPASPPLRIGEEKGKGFGSHQGYGRDLQYARQAPLDQAWLSRDPVGPALVSEVPAFNADVSIAQEGPKGGPIGVAPVDSLIAPVVGPPAQLVKLMPASAFEAIAKGPDDQRPPSTKPVKDVATAVVIGAEPSEARAPDQRSETVTAGAPKQAAGPAADAAPESDSESDAFARIGSAVLKDGKLDVRLGRKVKTVKPRFTIKGGHDFAFLMNPVTVVRIAITETGKVSDVQVLRSSGSNEIDLPWVLAVYKWWIEPPKDAEGKPTGDIIRMPLQIITD